MAVIFLVTKIVLARLVLLPVNFALITKFTVVAHGCFCRLV